MDRVGHYRRGCREHPYRFMCEVCGEWFDTKRCTATLCSPKCRQSYSRDIRRVRALAALGDPEADTLRDHLVQRRRNAAVGIATQPRPSRPATTASSCSPAPPEFASTHTASTTKRKGKGGSKS